MPAEIVNLRRARKARDRADRQKTAAENRRRHGLSKAEKQAELAERRQAERHIDAHRREPPEE
jgi:Domain of unknown function (DUF4169)